MSLQKDGYVIVKNALSTELCRVLAAESKLLENLIINSNVPPSYPDCSTDKFPHNDSVRNSFAWYSPLCFEAISNTVIKDIIESEIGEEIYPTYSYLRIYYPGSVLPAHTDRASSDLAVTCCISVDKSSKPWPIGLIDRNNNTILVDQNPGDIIIYRGTELTHWRDTYMGREQIQCFLFYVLKHGPKAELKYDTRGSLGFPWTARKLSSEEQNDQFKDS